MTMQHQQRDGACARTTGDNMEHNNIRHNIKTLLGMCIFACLANITTATAAHAADAGTAAAKPAKKAVKKAAVKHKGAKPAEKAGPLLDEDGKEFKAGDDTATELDCELGNKLTIYRNATDSEHMALRWQQRVHRMTRVSTSTGANRFENSRYGLVWIGIPAKGMLLDSKRGQQLANECKDAEQLAPKPAAVVAPTKPADLPAPIEAPRADPAADLNANPAPNTGPNTSPTMNTSPKS
jgi:hypothetical protein